MQRSHAVLGRTRHDSAMNYPPYKLARLAQGLACSRRPPPSVPSAWHSAAKTAALVDEPLTKLLSVTAVEWLRLLPMSQANQRREVIVSLMRLGAPAGQ